MLKKKWYRRQRKTIKVVSPVEYVKLRRVALAEPLLVDILEIFNGKILEVKAI